MKWAYGIRRKISAALLLAAIFVLLFVKSMIESSNVSRLGDSFSSVYEDRLVVATYIYKMSDHLFRKKIMIDTSQSPSAVAEIKDSVTGHSNAIHRLVAAYEETQLTETEQSYFRKFKQNVEALTDLEQEWFRVVSNGKDPTVISARINEQFNDASYNLDQLSLIQTSEGKLLNESSQKIVAGSSLLTYFELGILIAIGLMVFVLVFESSAIFSKPSGDRLN